MRCLAAPLFAMYASAGWAQARGEPLEMKGLDGKGVMWLVIYGAIAVGVYLYFSSTTHKQRHTHIWNFWTIVFLLFVGGLLYQALAG